VLELEDLHWADNESLDFLAYLGEVNRDAPMLVVAAAGRRCSSAGRAGARRACTGRIELQPLGKDMSRMLASELLRSFPRCPSRCAS
jgi:predicted ATPase